MKFELYIMHMYQITFYQDKAATLQLTFERNLLTYPSLKKSKEWGARPQAKFIASRLDPPISYVDFLCLSVLRL